MNSNGPLVILRLGTHAEKEYLEKTIHFLDGIIVGANLVEATPGATASLIVKFAGERLPVVPYYIDPMTYAFGIYTDPSTKKVRDDLDWIKSDQKKGGHLVRDFKRSYRNLATRFGDPFKLAVARSRALTESDFPGPEAIHEACQASVNFQITRLKEVFSADPEYREYADQVPSPIGVFAPYFYVEPSNWHRLTELNLNLAKATVGLGVSVPVYMIICADETFLLEGDFLELIKNELPNSGVRGVWLWFSRFFEDSASRESLQAFRGLVESLSSNLEVYSMHGGYFSLALAKFGMRGISHGIGYGEQKDVVPVIGQSTPTVRYYLPALHKRLGVPEIEICFRGLGVEKPKDFHERVCDCAVCKGVVANSLLDFSAFGEMHRSTPQSKRRAQTPAAAKRCRFHYLLTRFRERDEVRTSQLSDIIQSLSDADSTWASYQSVKSECEHLARWKKVLA